VDYKYCIKAKPYTIESITKNKKRTGKKLTFVDTPQGYVYNMQINRNDTEIIDQTGDEPVEPNEPEITKTGKDLYHYWFHRKLDVLKSKHDPDYQVEINIIMIMARLRLLCSAEEMKGYSNLFYNAVRTFQGKNEVDLNVQERKIIAMMDRMHHETIMDNVIELYIKAHRIFAHAAKTVHFHLTKGLNEEISFLTMVRECSILCERRCNELFDESKQRSNQGSKQGSNQGSTKRKRGGSTKRNRGGLTKRKRRGSTKPRWPKRRWPKHRLTKRKPKRSKKLFMK
jgi:hypothetical protein